MPRLNKQHEPKAFWVKQTAETPQSTFQLQSLLRSIQFGDTKHFQIQIAPWQAI